MNLSYISYSDYKKRGLDLSKIRSFSCGVEEFSHFLQEDIDLWESQLFGVTYFLIDTDISEPTDVNIYGYATLSTIGLLRKEAAKESCISGVEIRLFAVSEKFRGVKNELGILYSHIFFALLLQDLWAAATSVISFKMIFLQSNELGKSLYKNFGFVEVAEYLAPAEDEKIEIEECIPMLCEISDELMYKIFNSNT